VINVTDRGIGIDEADFEHIFQRYYQVKQTGVNNQPGVGLGLPISREIVRAHGGEITVNSQREGKHRESGTTFIVRVPVVPVPAESVPS
jgi:signal transduction histidine kinase